MRIFLVSLLLAFFVSVDASAVVTVKRLPMLSGATTTGAGSTFGPATSGEKAFQAVVSGSGSVSATVLIQVSNDVTNLGWVTLGTITLSGTTTATDGFVSEASWAYYRANVTAISGTSAAVAVTVAQE